MNFKKVLVLSPHTDDQTLGCGGLINKTVSNYGQVRICLFSHGGAGIKFIDNQYKTYSNYERLQNYYQATKLLGVSKTYFFIQPEKQDVNHHKLDVVPTLELVKFIQSAIIDFQPDCILIPYSGYDQDHIAVNKAGKVVMRAHFYSNSVMQYSVGSQLEFIPNYFVLLDHKDVQLKSKAFSCYQSQNINGHFYSEQNTMSFTKRHGLFVNHEYAEGYKVIRIKD